jgi:hypothetical protein
MSKRNPKFDNDIIIFGRKIIRITDEGVVPLTPLKEKMKSKKQKDDER